MHIVHTESSQGWGGQELRILSECEGLRARGHRVTVIAPRSARVHVEAQRRGLNAVDLPIARKSLRGVVALRRWLASNRADVVNTHSSTDSWLTAIACRALQAPPPIVRTRHVSVPVSNNALSRWLYTKAARRIVTTGAALRKQLIEQNHFPPDRIVSVPTGIPADRYAPGDRAAARAATQLPHDWLLIGIVATLRSWKGHHYLIDAYAQLPPDNVGLVIVGDGPQRAALEEQVQARRLAHRTWLAGDQHDVVPWLRALDIFALPSYANEGVPQALVQAMMVGLPCVTTAIGSIPEAARDGETALIVRPEDGDDLARALARLIADPAMRSTLGRAARVHCVREFGYESMLDRMEAVFRDAVAAP